MELTEASLLGVFELRPVVHSDARGLITEGCQQERFTALGIPDSFVQDNRSRSSKSTFAACTTN